MLANDGKCVALVVDPVILPTVRLLMTLTESQESSVTFAHSMFLKRLPSAFRRNRFPGVRQILVNTASSAHKRLCYHV